MASVNTISKSEARKVLRQYAIDWNKPELAELADKLTSRAPKYPPARSRRRSLTPELAVDIRAYKAKHPEMSCVDIGAVFNVNGGRVSEALHSVNENGYKQTELFHAA